MLCTHSRLFSKCLLCIMYEQVRTCLIKYTNYNHRNCFVLFIHITGQPTRILGTIATEWPRAIVTNQDFC